MLHKHGIDLGDSNGIADGRKTKRMDPKEVEMLMGGGVAASSHGAKKIDERYDP